jgi:hypothetical protein
MSSTETEDISEYEVAVTETTAVEVLCTSVIVTSVCTTFVGPTGAILISSGRCLR